MIDYTNFEEVKKESPIEKYISVDNKTIKITGYFFDGAKWWPANLIQNVMFVRDNGEWKIEEIPETQMRNRC